MSAAVLAFIIGLIVLGVSGSESVRWYCVASIPITLIFFIIATKSRHKYHRLCIVLGSAGVMCCILGALRNFLA